MSWQRTFSMFKRLCFNTQSPWPFVEMQSPRRDFVNSQKPSKNGLQNQKKVITIDYLYHDMQHYRVNNLLLLCLRLLIKTLDERALSDSKHCIALYWWFALFHCHCQCSVCGLGIYVEWFHYEYSDELFDIIPCNFSSYIPFFYYKK